MEFNLLSANPTEWSNTLKQFFGRSRRIVWVCLTIIWGWRLKGYEPFSKWHKCTWLGVILLNITFLYVSGKTLEIMVFNWFMLIYGNPINFQVFDNCIDCEPLVLRWSFLKLVKIFQGLFIDLVCFLKVINFT